MFTAAHGLSRVAANVVCSAVAAHRLLTVVASLASEHRLSGAQPSVVLVCRLSSFGPQALECGLSSCGTRAQACGIFLEQGMSPCLRHWKVDSQPLDHQRSPKVTYSETNYLAPCTQDSNPGQFESKGKTFLVRVAEAMYVGKMRKYGFWTHKNSMGIFDSWGDTGDDDSEENQEEVREKKNLASCRE